MGRRWVDPKGRGRGVTENRERRGGAKRDPHTGNSTYRGFESVVGLRSASNSTHV